MHQHVVDTYAIQTANDDTKPIAVVQALVGLYLHVEHGLTGRQVQRVHKILADRRPEWPRISLPSNRSPMTVRDVLARRPGVARDHAIEEWASQTWTACRALGRDLETFLISNGIRRPRAEEDP